MLLPNLYSNTVSSPIMQDLLQSHILFLQTANNTVTALQNFGLNFDLLDDDDHEWMIVGHAETEVGKLRILIGIRDNPVQWVLFVYHPLAIVSTLRPIAAELLMRINSELAIGNWEMDMDSGSIRFRIGLSVEGQAISIPHMTQTLDTAMLALLKYHTPLVHTLFDGMDPVEALGH